jgi:hypothetical protein
MVLIAIAALGLATRSAVVRAAHCFEVARESDRVASGLTLPENQMGCTRTPIGPSGAERYSQAAREFRRIAWRFWEPVPRAPGFLGMLEEWVEQQPDPKQFKKTRRYQTKPMAR